MKVLRFLKRITAFITLFAVIFTNLLIPVYAEKSVVRPNPGSGTASEWLNYASALQYALYLFDANMCGSDVDEKCALDWRGNCHTYDTYEYNGRKVDLSGGYHDAGDHVKFGLPAAYTSVTLHLGYYEFKEVYIETNLGHHLRTIQDRFAEYFMKCAVYDKSGKKIEAFCYQVGTGNHGDDEGYDHSYWGSPEEQPKEYENGQERIAYFTSPENPCSDIVAATAAALAAHYVNYGDKQALKVAKDLFDYMKSNEIKISYVPQYPRWEDRTNPADPWDYISLAALWLNLATQSNDYDDMVNPLEISKKYTDWPSNWDGVWPMVNVLKEEWRAVENNCKSNYGNDYRFIMKWGSARLNANLQFIGLIYDKYNDTTRYTEWAKKQTDIIFGNNKHNQAYIVGYNYREDIQYPLYPHHRASDGYTESPEGPWNEDTNEPMVQRPQAHVIVGALVGGPESYGGAYYDSLNNYVGNEVAIDYSAGFINALAGLYLAYGREDLPVSPPSLIAEGVKDTYDVTVLNPYVNDFDVSNPPKDSNGLLPWILIGSGVALTAIGSPLFLNSKKRKKVNED